VSDKKTTGGKKLGGSEDMKNFSKRRSGKLKQSKPKSVVKPQPTVEAGPTEKSSPKPKPSGIKPEPYDVKAAQDIIFQPNPGPQTEFLASSEQEVLFGGAAGGGKLVQKGDPVLTPTGFVKVEELKEGDTICGVDGTVQRITQLKDWETLPKWTVEFSDGTFLETAGEHLWEFWMSRDGSKTAKVLSTSVMKEKMDRLGKRAQVRASGLCVFKEKPVPIDPYFLGVLLGDGCLTTNQITITAHEDDQPHYLKEFDPKDVRVTKQTVRFIGETRKKTVDSLRKYGLIKIKSFDKFIPEDYLINSSEVRSKILQGLMDTDGYSAPGENAPYFYSVSPKLVKGVEFLVRSLGGTVTTTSKIGKYRDSSGNVVECQKCFNLYIRHPEPDSLFSLPRKKHGKFSRNLCQKAVKRVYQEGEVTGRCISVSNEDGLYITKDFIVTHNSYAMLADPLRFMNEPLFRGLLLRKTTDDLRELKEISQAMYPKAIPGIRWSERLQQWIAPSGATLWMTYLDKDNDLARYWGQAYTWIGFDELTKWPTPVPWDILRSRLRTTKGSGLKLYQRATTNPGSIGHAWVKKMFIDPAPAGEAFWATDITTGETLTYPDGDPLAGKPLLRRRFIPSMLSDNPYLAEDGNYRTNLLSLPEKERKQLLEGDWTVAEGAAFTEFNPLIHVVEPFTIPHRWTRFRACDYGYGSTSAVLWFAVDPRDDSLIVYRELYTTKVTAVDLADMVLDLERDERIQYGVLDSSLWHNRGDTGPSLAEQMIQRGCRWTPSDRSKGSRIAGKNEIHRRLQVDEGTKKPRMVFFKNCKNMIEELPLLPLDSKNPEDIDTKVSFDHGYDTLRYGIMSRPKSNVWDFNMTTVPSRHRPVDLVFGY